MSEKSSASLTDLAKRLILAGIGSAAQAKDLISDGRLQKELINSILSKAEKRKDDLMEILAREVAKFLGKVNVADEIAKALSGMIINLSATIDFTQSKDVGKPRVTVHEAKTKKKK